jgi:glucosamine 6-phosphate synthetase-like amidotransferase/phosphosugar isomerase protein
VFGVYEVPDASAVCALGLHALQHRGQEACGIASFDGSRFHTERHMGHVGDAFAGADLVSRLPGTHAIGHTRYSTAGGSFIRNVQPMFADLQAGGVALAHNGNLTNFLVLREQLVDDGAIFQSTSDSEVILHLIARSRKAKVVDRFIDALSQIEGGYALVAMTNKKMIDALKIELDETLGTDLTIISTNRFDKIDYGIVSRSETLELLACEPQVFLPHAKKMFELEGVDFDDQILLKSLEVTYAMRQDNRKYYQAIDSLFRKN